MSKSLFDKKAGSADPLVTPALLRGALAAFNKTPPTPFKVGDIVQWKYHMSNKKHPKEGTPAIICEVLDPPLTGKDLKDRESPGNAYFCEVLDIKLGVVDSDGDFLEFLFDSRRFELVEE